MGRLKENFQVLILGDRPYDSRLGNNMFHVGR